MRYIGYSEPSLIQKYENRIEQLEEYIKSLQNATIEDHKTIDWLRKCLFEANQKGK